MSETAQQAARRLAASAIRDGYRPDALYEYRDSNGAVVYHRIRCKRDSDGAKWIRPMRKNGHGFEIGEPEFPSGKPLLNLPDLIARVNAPAWFVEGELCADALAKLGMLATTSGGADSASHADFSPLANRRVNIWPDNDEPGLRHARQVANKLLERGATVRLVDIGKLNLPDKGDCVDWLAAHPQATATDLDKLPLVDAPTNAENTTEAAEAWPPPQPLIVRSEAAPYPVDALPGSIGAAVLEVVAFVQCPVSRAACCALAAVSLSCQALADVGRADKLTGPCGLYLLAVAESGERKTSCDGYFTSAIREWEREQAERTEPEVSRHAAALSAWTAKREGVLQAIKTAAKSGKSTSLKEDELDRMEADKPQAPRVPSLIFGDATPEALAFNLAQGWPSGGVLSSEAGIVFGSHAMGRESITRNLALLNSLWDGRGHKVHRRTADPFTVEGVRLTMGLAVQPETGRAFFENSKGLARGSAFVARFLIAWPQSTQGARLFRPAPESWPSLTAFHRRITALLDQTPAINARGELELPMLDLSPDATAAWIHFHDEVEDELRPGRDMAETRDVASKAADNAARLAALFHTFEHGASGDISAAHMHAASRIVTWHLYEARRFLGELVLPPTVSNAAKLDAWLLAHCRETRTTTVATREIQQYGPGPLRDKATLTEVIAELVDADRVRRVKDGNRREIEVNPALLEKS